MIGLAEKQLDAWEREMCRYKKAALEREKEWFKWCFCGEDEGGMI